MSGGSAWGVGLIAMIRQAEYNQRGRKMDMHFVKGVKYVTEYQLLLTFEDGVRKLVDLKSHLKGEIFKPLKDIHYFKTVSVNPDLDTIVWENNADFSPDFLYEIGKVVEEKSALKK